MTAVKQWGFFFDAAACSGCKACQVACKDRHDLKAGIHWRRVYEVGGGVWTPKGKAWEHGVLAYNISMACNHCRNPLCADSCPTKAITKRPDGIVLLDTTLCIGCRYCEWACPYGATRFDAATGLVTKCTFCADDVDAGEPPACVAACPGRALDFGDFDELKKKYGGTGRIFPLPEEDQTEPALVIRPHRDCARAEGAAADVINWEEV